MAAVVVPDTDGAEEEDIPLVYPGFRFHPTDDELLSFYLRRKVGKKPVSLEIIKQLDIYKYDPWDLPRVSGGGGEGEEDGEWYFFCLRGRKYRNSVRPNRVTDSGFWKATGIDKPVYSGGGGKGRCVGLKKTLVYYRGSCGKGSKTDWMMHEFRLPPAGEVTDKLEAEIWTICRIFRRAVSGQRKHTPSRLSPEDQPSHEISSAAAISCSSSSISSSSESAHRDFSHFAPTEYYEEQVMAAAGFFGEEQNQMQSVAASTLTIQQQQQQQQPPWDQYWAPQTPLPPHCPSFHGQYSVEELDWAELGGLMDFVADPVTAFPYF